MTDDKDIGFFRKIIDKLLKGKTGNIWIQIFRYLFSGGVAFIVDYSALYALTEWGGLHYLLSSSISFMLGLIVTYVFSILWIFDVRSREKKWEEFLIFAGIGLVGLGLTELFMYLFTSVIGLHYLVSKIITTILVTAWNFSAKKLLLFSRRRVRNG